MVQYQAGYILESVLYYLKTHAKKHNKETELNGLLRSLCTFNIETSVNLIPTTNIQPILAVAENILTRGLPTFTSIDIEQYFSNTLQLTHRVDNTEMGSIGFPLSKNGIDGCSPYSLFNVLHVVDPRARKRIQFLDVKNVDSSFERNFLMNLIPESHNYIVQLLEKQRTRNSLTRDNNQGRVDFSFEIPYDISKFRTNRYNNQVQIKHHKTFVVEIDGRKYHTDLIDDLKDFEIAQLSRTITHITEDKVYKDVDDFIRNISKEEYVKITEQNFNNTSYLIDPFTALVLSPLGIARLQRMILQYLISNYDTVVNKNPLKIAVVERDFPCAHIAIDDLVKLLKNLNDLNQSQLALPEIHSEVFSTIEFNNHPLHSGKNVKLISDLNPDQFDIILDISLLHRAGVFKEDSQVFANSILIRNAHYTHYQTTNGVVSSNTIIYKSVVNQLQNEVFEPIEETSVLLRKLLQDVFRKLDFKVGQLPILNRAIQLKSVIGLLPTGGGKSLTYQLAAMLQPGTTIVIDPIRSLMIDQYNGLKEIGIDKCEFINSTLTAVERNYNQHNLLAKGQLQFLFVSPERFVIDEFRKALDNAAKESHFFTYSVIDEVHCVSEWGHDFRTPYLNLGENAQKFCHTFSRRPIPLFGLTATASFDVLADIERELCIAEDDGNAVVRFENSVRDETNYIIKEVPNTYEGLDNLTEKAIKESTGRKKQDAIFGLIADKEKVIQQFNSLPALNNIISHSFKNYLPVSMQQVYLKEAGEETDALILYKSKYLERLRITDNPFQIKTTNGETSYGYGIIVFMPHRQGWLGVRNGYKSHGFYDNPEYIDIKQEEGISKHYFLDETLGYFIGSSDEDDSDRVDKESFEHLEYFKKNKDSIMVATKAFGMGIDKPNVRITIHINIPQSIESFVQEAGRAGRDGKISTSLILYNKESIKLGSRPNDLYHLDKDVLMYFHKNSFKGQIKERVMIYELRSKITFPNTNNLQMLTEQLNDLYGNENVQFKIVLGGANHPNRIFINTVSGTRIGFVYLDNQNTGIYHDYRDDANCHQLVDWLQNQIPFSQFDGLNNIKIWLEQVLVNNQQQIGLEKMLEDMQVGETKKLPIPFTNRYYSKKTKSKKFFILNNEHLQKILATEAIKVLVQSGEHTEQTIANLLKNAVFEGLDYEEFIESIKVKNELLLQKLLTLTDPISLELQKSYFMPRNQDDTAKAIYRLVSIGIIDSYTIDYQNKLYNITFTKKKKDDYYSSLEELIARYTSKNVAKREIEKLKEKAKNEIKVRTATVISKCLEYLTDFIYEKIKEKRLLAIEDMVRLCQTSIIITNPLVQNQHIKDEIYYYFNAKYSRRKFIEHTRNGDLEASMLDDLENELTINNTIEKYLALVENGETGEFISNIKHLRGSTMRMLRSYPEKPQFRILKSFSLFILADTIIELIDEAKEELVKGLIDWRHNEEPDLNVQETIIAFKNRIKNHVINYDINKAFSDIEDHYYASYYARWTENFNKQFLVKII